MCVSLVDIVPSGDSLRSSRNSVQALLESRYCIPSTRFNSRLFRVFASESVRVFGSALPDPDACHPRSSSWIAGWTKRKSDVPSSVVCCLVTGKSLTGPGLGHRVSLLTNPTGTNWPGPTTSIRHCGAYDPSHVAAAVPGIPLAPAVTAYHDFKFGRTRMGPGV
jgi:hypothetical protein